MYSATVTILNFLSFHVYHLELNAADYTTQGV